MRTHLSSPQGSVEGTHSRASPVHSRRPDTLAALLREVPGLVVSFRATPAAAGARGLATGPAASPGQGHPAFTHKTRFNPAPTTDADAPHEMDPAHDLYAIPDRPTDPVRRHGGEGECVQARVQPTQTSTCQRRRLHRLRRHAHTPTPQAMPPNPEAVIRHDHAAREVKRQAAYMGVWEHGAASPEAADVAAHDHGACAADGGSCGPARRRPT